MPTRILHLLQCPGCKGAPTLYAIRFTRYGTQYAIGCKDKHCGVSTTFIPNKTIDEMVDRWNSGIGLVRSGIPYGQIPGQMVAVEVVV